MGRPSILKSPERVDLFILEVTAEMGWWCRVPVLFLLQILMIKQFWNMSWHLVMEILFGGLNFCATNHDNKKPEEKELIWNLNRNIRWIWHFLRVLQSVIMAKHGWTLPHPFICFATDKWRFQYLLLILYLVTIIRHNRWEKY